jgi:zinc protease
MDPAVRTGKLANGLTYYIRHNDWPAHRAELRLAVNAGSVLEDENQRGLAHFLEHMMFNGTTQFPRHKLIDYLQSIGMGFGADINAATGFDQTVYQLTMPTDSAKFLATGLDVLHEWACCVTIDANEFERERKVIVEEWRMRRGVGSRIQDQQMPVEFNNALYAQRVPIGLMSVVEHAPREQLKRFYDDWYRPDLMAIVLVGDFNADSMEAVVKAKFSDLKPRVAKERPRPVINIPSSADTKYSIVSDSELTGSSGSVMFRFPAQKTRTVGDMRRDLIQSFYSNMLNARLGEIAIKPDAPFIAAQAGLGGMSPTTMTYSVGVRTKDNAIPQGLSAAMAEIERVRKFGFTQTELDRQKTNTLKSYDNAYEQRNKIPSANYVNDYVNSFLSGEPATSVEEDVTLGRAIVPTITLDDVNKLASEWLSDSNRVFTAVGPKKSGVTMPTESQLLAAYNEGLAAPVTAYVDKGAGGTFLAQLPTPGKIVSETKDAATGVVTWKLSNGIRVLVKQTDFTPDVESISGVRPGGTSLAPDSLMIPANTASQVIGASGLGSYDMVSLRKALTGKTVNVGTQIGTYNEGAGVSATPKDLETALQLMYMAFTEPRADTSMFKTIVENSRVQLANRAANPEQAFNDTISVTMSQHNKRAPIADTSMISKMDLGKSYAFYKQRFTDAGGFTFVMVGVMSPDSLKPLVERYIASLPATSAKHQYVDLGIRPPTGVIAKEVHRGEEPKSTSVIIFTGTMQDTPENQAKISAVKGVLELRVLELLRQKLGGTYTPQVQAGLSQVPHPSYQVAVIWGSDPNRVPELQTAVLAEIQKFIKEGPTDDELHKVKEEAARNWETALKNNQFWSNMIMRYADRGWALADIPKADDYLQAITPAQVREAAQQLLKMDNYAKFSMYPAVMPSAAPASTPSGTPATTGASR